MREKQPSGKRVEVEEGPAGRGNGSCEAVKELGRPAWLGPREWGAGAGRGEAGLDHAGPAG